ncbi:hypothetical protein LOTGIDRAFT_228061 [Lottia gigantea]|uniref:WD repeat-containing protein 93 n=1 Tax=Lottia gigantea TaxID=225164 RepID=V4BCR2_LOTGI|nr:hypothetical protein LOTGIDRAFT_228061 [Lottia gigantea]ESP05506.1 hypothetical protein LOTGIDRAFT_228061 [Lottia gigantea]
MPVYLRKNISFSPPSLENITDIDIEDDFTADPDLLRDKLPQPYRLINKIIDNVVEKAWTYISKVEEKKFKELNRVRPPSYDCSVKLNLEKEYNATGLSDSVDGRYVFFGTSNGIIVLDALQQSIVTVWEEEKVDVVHIKCHLIGVQTYLLVTIDELGVAKLFIFQADHIFLLKVLNEQESATNKIITSKCEASAEGDYVGIFLENPSKNETWLEVYRLPRDTWLREMETVVGELQSIAQSAAQQQEEDVEGTDNQMMVGERRPSVKVLTPHTVGERRRSSVVNLLTVPPDDSSTKTKKRRKGRNRSSSPRPGTPPPLLTLTPGEKPSPKFTPPSLVIKIHPPSPITACTTTSLQSACQKVDSGEVIGTGQNHVLSGSHLDLRDAMFNHLNEKLLPYLKDDDEKEAEVIQPTFHFVPSSRLSPLGLEQPSQTGKPTNIIVWWTGETNIKHYSLLKTGKDFEFKPDLVWPICNKVKSTAVSKCGSFLAIGLSNGTVVMWDRYLGVEKGIVNIEEKSSISFLKFLDSSLSATESISYPPYKTTNTACLLIQTTSGCQYIYNTSLQTLVTLQVITEEDDDVQVLLSTMKAVPELLLVVSKDGSLILKDVVNGNSVCQLTLPKPYSLTSPWEPIYCFGAGGQMLFVKGSYFEKNEEGGLIDLSAVFIYQLRSFPTLDTYWQHSRELSTEVIHPTLDKRINSLLRYRISQQASRKERMQERWGIMKDELDVILQCKETSKHTSRTTITPSTYRSTPPALR